MNKTLFGLAYINYEYEINKKDLIDTYIPLFQKIILKGNYSIITRDILYNDFVTEYGIIIPLAVVEIIIKRMIKNEFLKNQIGEIHVIHSAFANLKVDDQASHLETEFSIIVKDIIEFSTINYSLIFTKDEIEDALLSFLKEYDLDILFGSEDVKILAKQTQDIRKVKYVIAKYIYGIGVNNSKAETILKIAKGYSIASLITYKDIASFKGSLSNVEVYLDTPILYNLLGLNGEPNIQLTQELLQTLRKNGAKLKIFSVHHLELINSLRDAIEKLKTKAFELNKSSRLIKTAVREKISSSQMQLKANQLNEVLDQYQINIESPLYNTNDKSFQIDESKLKEEIVSLYHSKNNQIPGYVHNQIDNDVTSISNIFRIRRSVVANSLKHCKAILITNNEVLAFAAKKFEKNEWPYRSTIPVCLTDIFTATILWANYPSTNEGMNFKKLMCECYFITDLDNRILKKFYEDVEKAHKENAINTDQYHLLNASNVAYELLEKKTLNDIDLYNSTTTPREILEEMESRYEGQLRSEQNINNRIFSNIDRFCSIIGRCSFIIIGIILILIALLVKYYTAGDSEKWYYFLIIILGGFLAIFGILRWMELIPTRKNVENSISLKLSNAIKSILIK